MNGTRQGPDGRTRLVALALAAPAVMAALGLSAVEAWRIHQPSALRAGSSSPGAGRIMGVVFDDRNQNEVFDPDDHLMPGVTVILTDRAGMRSLGSTSTGADGHFRFDSLPPADYRVTLETPPGFERATDDSLVLAVTERRRTAEVKFGVMRRERRSLARVVDR